MKTLSCVVKGPKNVDVITQQIEYSAHPEKTLVQITRGGICGSDLHYYQHGKIGNFEVKHPMILGHEVIGKIYQTTSQELSIGQKVAINPSKPCLECKYCLAGETNQCEKMRFFGSAMYNPHVDGGFSQFKEVDTVQCISYPQEAPDEVMVFAEPLAVAIHALKQAGDVQGKRLFVSGVGPIGCLVVAAAKVLGAREIVCADLSHRCLDIATEMGASKALLAGDDFSAYSRHKGEFDVSFEVSGHPSSIERCLSLTKAKGTIIQIGMGGNIPNFPVMTLIAKEINWKGTFRFVEEFNTAVEWLGNGKLDPLPLLSATFPFQQLEQAMITAGNKNEIAKVQLTFNE